jgi:NAD(P)-dependent dehydrogenase (short-subunit alcohol dehydrogenase family)
MTLLSGKSVLITGGTSGIGRASALLFAKNGAKVALTGRQKDAGDEVVEAITSAGGVAFFIQADLTDFSQAQFLVDKTVEHYGRVDCTFNNAGVAGGGLLGGVSEQVWDKVVDANTKAAFFCLQAQAEQMKKQQSGSILFNASVLAHIAFPGVSVYSASKGALVALARAAAVELGPYGIRVNSLNPSITRTPMTQGRITLDEQGRDTHPFGGGVPLGRIAEAEEMASVAMFLLSDLASYVTGQALIVDGGQSAM